MNNLLRLLTILFLVGASTFGTSTNAQSPTPILVQAANSSAPATVPSKPVSTTEDQSMAAAIKLLEQMKATNNEILAKQKAALERLDEVKEAADQLQIFAKRG